MDPNDTMAFNIVVDLKDTSFHYTRGCANDEDSLYGDEEDEKLLFEELQEKYNLMYTKWIDLVKINKALKKNLEEVQDQKESLEIRNYELIAQVKDMTERLNSVESRIARMNTGKRKLDEILEGSRPARLKTGLGIPKENKSPMMPSSLET